MLRGVLGDPLFKGQFSGHEMIPLRHGWLKKVVDALFTKNSAKRNLVFVPDHAIAHFGVGKNMVVSTKYWAPPVVWLCSPAADRITGNRCAAPIAWPQLAESPVWPGGRPDD